MQSTWLAFPTSLCCSPNTPFSTQVVNQSRTECLKRRLLSAGHWWGVDVCVFLCLPLVIWTHKSALGPLCLELLVWWQSFPGCTRVKGGYFRTGSHSPCHLEVIFPIGSSMFAAVVHIWKFKCACKDTEVDYELKREKIHSMLNWIVSIQTSLRKLALRRKWGGCIFFPV